jgi:hypothetical protein
MTANLTFRMVVEAAGSRMAAEDAIYEFMVAGIVPNLFAEKLEVEKSDWDELVMARPDLLVTFLIPALGRDLRRVRK